MDAREYKKAVPILQKLIAAEAGNPGAHHLLGICHLQLGSYDLAESELECALKLQPNKWPNTIELLGLVKLMKGEVARAEALISEAVQMDPTHKYAHRHLAECHLVSGKLEEAVQEAGLQVVVDAGQPAEKDSHFILAYAYDLLGRYSAAAGEYIKADGGGPLWTSVSGGLHLPPGVRFARGLDCLDAAAHRYFLAREYAKAEEISLKQSDHGRLGAVLSTRPTGVRIEAHLKGGGGERAGLQVGDVISSVDGTKVSSPADVIEILMSRKPGSSVSLQLERGGEQLTKVVTLGKFDQPVRAWCLLARGQYDEAIREFEAFLGKDMLDPWPPARQGLSIALYGKGQQDKAKAAWGSVDLGINLRVYPPSSNKPAACWVWPGGPAQRAGMKNGDSIVSYAGEQVQVRHFTEVVPFLERISRTPAGTPVPIRILREGKEMELRVTP